MKDLSKILVVKELINSLHLLKKHAFWLVIAAFVDAVFFVAWGFFTTPIKDKILEHAVLIANELSVLMSQKQAGVLGHLISPELRPLTGKLVFLIFLLFAVIYVIYSAFQGTTWWMATQISEKKWKYRDYLLGFAKVNLIWIGASAIYKFLDVIIGLRHLLIEKFAPGTPNIAGKVLFVAIALLSAAAFLSYPTLKAKTIFKTPLKISAGLILLSASIYLATQFILNSISKASLDLALVAGLILLFPVIILIKVYAIRVISNVHARD